jgi:hypothetical protein
VAVNCKADRSPADFVAVKLKRALSLRDLTYIPSRQDKSGKGGYQM